MSEIKIAGEMNGALLAYLGDAQMELLIRRRLVLKGGRIGSLNKEADGLVSAKAQTLALQRLMPIFTEDELEIFRRGKNVHTSSTPKSVTKTEYRKATGLEAVFGYLCLKGDTERMEELIDIAYFF